MSNEVTIEQMNEAIARFDGWETHFYNDTLFFRKEGKSYFNSDLKYHTSWDWLMPVGKKIRDLLNDMQKQRPPHTACNGDLIEVDIHCAVSDFNIVNAHKHMYTFITWYNKCQQHQTNDERGTNKG